MPNANRTILAGKGYVGGEREDRLSKQGWRMQQAHRQDPRPHRACVCRYGAMERQGPAHHRTAATRRGAAPAPPGHPRPGCAASTVSSARAAECNTLTYPVFSCCVKGLFALHLPASVWIRPFLSPTLLCS